MSKYKLGQYVALKDVHTFRGQNGGAMAGRGVPVRIYGICPADRNPEGKDFYKCILPPLAGENPAEQPYVCVDETEIEPIENPQEWEARTFSPKENRAEAFTVPKTKDYNEPYAIGEIYQVSTTTIFVPIAQEENTPQSKPTFFQRIFKRKKL